MVENTKKSPRHIGIIMDGNRRFAKKNGKLPWTGHEAGAKTMLDTMKWAKELGVKQLTFYAFSTENFKRPKLEFDSMMKLFVKLANKILEKVKEAKNAVCIRFVGLLHLFPKHVRDMMRKVMDATRKFKDFVVNIAVGYGGRIELIKAFKSLHNKIRMGKISVDQINEETISRELFVSSEPEMIIRTGGAKRLSNFLLWQASYSEIYFLDKLWPEFGKQDLAYCINDYNSNVQINLGK